MKGCTNKTPLEVKGCFINDHFCPLSHLHSRDIARKGARKTTVALPLESQEVTAASVPRRLVTVIETHGCIPGRERVETMFRSVALGDHTFVTSTWTEGGDP